MVHQLIFKYSVFAPHSEPDEYISHPQNLFFEDIIEYYLLIFFWYRVLNLPTCVICVLIISPTRAICPAYLTPVCFNHNNDVTDLKVLLFTCILKFRLKIEIGTLQNFFDCQWGP